MAALRPNLQETIFLQDSYYKNAHCHPDLTLVADPERKWAIARFT